ncbi:metallo-beta-lactamase family protein isoform X2 [Wolffia australiana]
MGILVWPRPLLPSQPSRIHGRRRSSPTPAELITAPPTASTRRRRSQNTEGEFYVDERCIDCDTCRWMAPETFQRISEQSAVYKQPSGAEERMRALQALLSCPTASIHTEKPSAEIRQVQESFPLPIDEQSLPGVRFCGYHSEKSFGATSYLVIHPNGNILVDSPRYDKGLARRIRMLGGARYMFLTHKDDVGDHHLWHDEFGLERIIHSADVEAFTADAEMQLHGEGPWSLGVDFDLIHTPGHTKGSVCLLYKPLKVLFTGDHLAASEDMELTMFEQYSKDSGLQLGSIWKLMNSDFLWILPGHGRRVEFRDKEERGAALKAFISAKEIEHGHSARA